MNQLQSVITRVLKLEKPIDKRLLWVVSGALALFAYLVFSGLSDSSSGVKVKAAQQVSPAAKNSADAVVSPKIYVHVVGQVVRPGIYELSSNSRVVDAIFAASGFARKADQASINLARIMTDGEQINVSALGSANSLAGVGGTKSVLSLNAASEKQLEELPSIGPTLAARITEWRAANGGFKSKNDLLKVSGIGDNLFSKIKDLVSL